MDKLIININEGRNGLTATFMASHPVNSTLLERAIVSQTAKRLEVVIGEEKAKLLKALQGVAGALSDEDKEMLEYAAEGVKKEESKPKT